MNNLSTKESPFTPGRPVPREFFVGRLDLINNLLTHIEYSKNNNNENFILIGDRGIGKSSLASLLNYIVNKEREMLGVHIFFGGTSKLDEMVKVLFTSILNASTIEKQLLNKIKNVFGNSISEIGILGLSLKFNPPKEHLKEIVYNLPEALESVIKNISPQKKGLFLILDDIDNLADNIDFPNWYKSFVDRIGTKYNGKLALFSIMICTPDKRDKIYKLQPSINRIFTPIMVERLNDTEVENFYINAFKTAKIEIEKDALDSLVFFSGGFPALMQEIGDSVFWCNKDNIIDKNDTMEGIIKAAENIGKKYLIPNVYRALHSKKYKSILDKIINSKSIITEFTTTEIRKKLTSDEQKVFHHFLKKFVTLGIIERDTEKERGSYKFVNIIYPIYMHMQFNTKIKKRHSNEQKRC
jgi:energy-coupling factor transporter ATP-binding protein EcfA2